jgi:hypothetical protein
MKKYDRLSKEYRAEVAKYGIEPTPKEPMDDYINHAILVYSQRQAARLRADYKNRSTHSRPDA